MIRRGLRGLRRLANTVHIGPTDGLTRVGEEEPSELPVDTLWRGVETLYQTGLYPAVALCIRHQGRVVMDRTVGHLDNAPGGALGPVATPDTLFSLFSASKLLTAMLVHALAEDGALRLDQPVADFLPAFSRHGKHSIRVHHLLSHTAGITNMPRDVDPLQALGTGRFPLESLHALRPDAPPGQRVAYNPMTAWLLLGEILERASGTGLRELAHERLLGPLGFEQMSYGVAPEDIPRVARHAFTGPPVNAVMQGVFKRTIGVDVETAVRISNTPEFLTGVLPSANVVATGREVTRFLELLRNEGRLDGLQVLKPETVRRAVRTATPTQLDGTMGFPMRYGLGPMKGGDRFSLFGLNTRGAFGHLGFSTVVVYSDPRRELSVSLLNTGKPMLAPGMLRWFELLQRIAFAVSRR